MMIRSLADVNLAIQAGRTHTQPFVKNAGPTHSLAWADPTYSSGKPGYDAHVGSPLNFVPCIAQGNDSIFIPGIDAGQTRHLLSMAIRSSQTTFLGAGSLVMFDLLGFYPLVDGDSTDLQTMINSLTLPRYADGIGVQMVIVNHVAPATQHGTAVINYIDSDGNAKSTTVMVINNGQGNVSTGSNGTTAASLGAYAIPLAGGSKGVRQVTSIQYTTAPSGLHCIYLIKPLVTAITGDNNVFLEKEMPSKNGFILPQIYDGAWLGWFERIGSGTATTVTWFGNLTFVWG